MENTMINPRSEESLPDPIVNPLVFRDGQDTIHSQTVRWFYDYDPIPIPPMMQNEEIQEFIWFFEGGKGGKGSNSNYRSCCGNS